jgi:hypothetical protein
MVTPQCSILNCSDWFHKGASWVYV